DFTIRAWEPATGSCPLVMKTSGWYVSKVAWSPDGKRLASAEAPGVYVRDAISGQVLAKDLRKEEAESVAWSPDGQHLALGTASGRCLLYDPADCSVASQWEGHSGKVNWVAWNPDGSRLASAGADNLIKLWDPGSRTCLGILRGH